MSCIDFTRLEVTAAIARGVQQCVVIEPPPKLCEALGGSPATGLQFFEVTEKPSQDCPATIVHTHFDSEDLSAALEKSGFDKLKSSLFVWFGGAGYRTIEAVVASLAFIAKLPGGSGVLLDYAAERHCLASWTNTALDALASRVSLAEGKVGYHIQPAAVSAMLHSFGFRNVVDLPDQESEAGAAHLVSASL